MIRFVCRKLGPCVVGCEEGGSLKVSPTESSGGGVNEIRQGRDIWDVLLTAVGDESFSMVKGKCGIYLEALGFVLGQLIEMGNSKIRWRSWEELKK